MPVALYITTAKSRMAIF